MQQSKSIHELSKIRNLNEFPLPVKFVKLPDVPLPKVKSIIGLIARVPKRKPRSASASGAASAVEHEEFGYTPVSTPKNLATDYTDDEMLR